MIHDPVRDRMLVFGGIDNSNDPFDDVWALNLGGPSWAKINPQGAGSSGARVDGGRVRPGRGIASSCSAASTGVRSGTCGPLSLSGTPHVEPTHTLGNTPMPRYLHCAVRIPSTNEMLVIAGTDSTLYDDVWKLTLSGSPAWTQLSPAGPVPPARFHAAAIYDPVRTRVVLYGGSDLAAAKADTWALSVSGTPTWTQLAPTGFLPAARYGHSAIYDTVRDG
jgi:hypothetical protein